MKVCRSSYDHLLIMSWIGRDGRARGLLRLQVRKKTTDAARRP
jgi:hypothetical protein